MLHNTDMHTSFHTTFQASQWALSKFILNAQAQKYKLIVNYKNGTYVEIGNFALMNELSKETEICNKSSVESLAYSYAS